jgi:hypothetical protein
MYEVAMQSYSVFVSYLRNQLSNEWRKMPPIAFQASNEEEAARTAIILANFAFPEFVPNLLIQVVADYDPGRPIAEIRRPISS